MWPSPQGSGGPTGNPGDGFAVVLLGADEGETAVDLEGLAAFVSAVGLDEGVWPAHGPQRRKKCREGAEAELQRARRQPDTADSRPATRKPPAMPALNRKAALLVASIGRMSRPRNGGPGHPPTPCGLGQVRENWAWWTGLASDQRQQRRRERTDAFAQLSLIEQAALKTRLAEQRRHAGVDEEQRRGDWIGAQQQTSTPNASSTAPYGSPGSRRPSRLPAQPPGKPTAIASASADATPPPNQWNVPQARTGRTRTSAVSSRGSDCPASASASWRLRGAPPGPGAGPRPERGWVGFCRPQQRAESPGQRSDCMGRVWPDVC